MKPVMHRITFKIWQENNFICYPVGNNKYTQSELTSPPEVFKMQIEQTDVNQPLKIIAIYNSRNKILALKCQKGKCF